MSTVRAQIRLATFSHRLSRTIASRRNNLSRCCAPGSQNGPVNEQMKHKPSGQILARRYRLMYKARYAHYCTSAATTERTSAIPPITTVESEIVPSSVGSSPVWHGRHTRRTVGTCHPPGNHWNTWIVGAKYVMLSNTVVVHAPTTIGFFRRWYTNH
jgi:hypothetical protein